MIYDLVKAIRDRAIRDLTNPSHLDADEDPAVVSADAATFLAGEDGRMEWWYRLGGLTSAMIERLEHETNL